MAIGIILGTLIGVLTDNMGTWLAIGVALGAGIGRYMVQKEADEEEE